MKIRNLVWVILAIGLLLAVTSPGFGDDDISKHRSCTHCGMDRKAYGYSRMLVVYEDGMQVGVCSLHCAVTDIASHPDKKMSALKVADRNSYELLDAQKAIWVVGGSKRGVMTGNPKWAFASQSAARSFIRDYGGGIATWEEVLSAARSEATRD